jgi:hypothetical protein
MRLKKGDFQKISLKIENCKSQKIHEKQPNRSLGKRWKNTAFFHLHINM